MVADTVPDCRQAVRGLVLPGQRRLHMSDESDRRRRQILTTVNGLPVQARVLEVRRDHGLSVVGARAALIRHATDHTVEVGVTSWTLDGQDEAQEMRDRRTISQALRFVDGARRPAYRHAPSESDPLLWVADAVAWAAGAGREWRRRVSEMSSHVRISP